MLVIILYLYVAVFTQILRDDVTSANGENVKYAVLVDSPSGQLLSTGVYTVGLRNASCMRLLSSVE